MPTDDELPQLSNAKRPNLLEDIPAPSTEHTRDLLPARLDRMSTRHQLEDLARARQPFRSLLCRDNLCATPHQPPRSHSHMGREVLGGDRQRRTLRQPSEPLAGTRLQ